MSSSNEQHSITATPPKVALVTVTYNSANVIDGFLQSLLRQSERSFLLFIVDNASSDETIRKIAAFHDDRIKVIANETNVGIAEANNQGIVAGMELGCEYILLMNNDTEFGTELLATLLRGIEQSESDMIAPKILFHAEPNTIWSAGGGLDSRKAYSGFHFGYGETDRGQFDTPRYVDHAPACCLLVRTEVFRRVGLMDPRYFTYVEDTDFSFRAKRAGLRLLYLPSAVLLHKAHSLTGGMFSDFMMRYTTRNRIYFILKHLGPLRALYYLPAYQLHLLLQLLSRQPYRRYSSLSMFWLREKAMLEGWRLWWHSTRSNAPV